MANPLRGEASFRAGNETYTLVFDTNAFCELEDDTGLDTDGVFKTLQGSVSFTILRTIICTALQRKHPATTKEQAGDIMSDAGAAVVMDALRKALVAAMPQAKGGNAKPTARGRGGTG